MNDSTTPSHGQPSPERIYQAGFGFWGAQVLMTANELDLFTTLDANGPLSAEELRNKLGLDERGATDFFDALVALGFLERNDGRYTNTLDTGTFLVRTKPTFVGGLFDMCSDRLYKSWGGLRNALETGNPQNRELTDTFENLYRDEKRLRQFASAMTGVSMGTARAIAEKFPWKNYKTFVDVGCAQGGTPVQITLAHEHLQGTGFDLPVIRPVFDEYVKSFGLDSRLTFAPGDFFKDELPNADVIIMGHILHDWNLDEKRMLVEKAYRALKPGGAFLVYEALIDDDRRHNAFGLMMSLNMLVETSGGFDFTGADCCNWMKEAGFRETRVQHLIGPDSMAIGIK